MLLAINHHPQVEIIERYTRPTHPMYLCNARNKMSKINNGSHKDGYVDTIDNMILTFS
jgi:hypothetical protein